MKLLFVIVFGEGIFLTVCNAACFVSEPKFYGRPIKGCLYDGKIHAFSSTWITKHCISCQCHGDGSVSCCDLINPSFVFGRDDCEVLEDKKTCTTRIVYKNDHTKDCL